MAASNDFRLLMDHLFKQKKKIEKLDIHIKNNDQEDLVILFDDKSTFTSTESDVVDYAWHLKQTIDSDGQYVIVAYKDLNKYFKDIDFLIRDEKLNIPKASKEVADGTYKFDFDPDLLVEEFLKSDRKKSLKFIKLKTEYYYILAFEMNQAATAINQLKIMRSKNKDFNRYYLGIEKLYAKAFRNDPNFIKNFLTQKRTNNFDLLDNVMQLQSAVKHADLIKNIFPSGGIPADKGVSLMLDMYRRYAEACIKPLNLLRIGQELVSGNSAPDLNKGAWENKKILEPELGALLDCYDPRIRNSESHLSTQINAKDKTVSCYDTRDGKRTHLVTYSYTELANMTNEIMHNLSQALAFTMYMEWRTLMLVITYKSPEYRIALLGIGNT